MSKITVEIDARYQEHLDLIKQMFPNEDESKAPTNSEVVEELIESFMDFLRQQAEAGQAHQHSEDGSCCGGH